jgi:hypothetical protein
VNLVASNLERFSTRRLTRILLLFAIALTVVIIGFQTVHGHRFVTHEQAFFAPDAGNPAFGNVQSTPILHDTRVDIAAHLSQVFAGVGVLLVCLAFVLGASFVGAETGASGLSTQLMYEPRRWRMHAAKTAAVAISCAAVAICVCCVIAATMLLGSHLHGIVPHVRSDWWKARAREIGRVALACSLAGVMAYAITLVVKRTGAGIVLFLVQLPLAAMFMRLQERGQPDSLLAKLARAVPYYGLQILVLGRDHIPHADQYEQLRGVTTSAAGLALAGAWAIALLLIAGVLFARSEVR